MSNFLKGLLLSIAIFIGFDACTPTETTIANEGALSDTPAWFAPSGFETDSLAFHGFAMAVSSDSVIAMANAELQARANLESGIAEKLESVREDLEDSGSSIATNTDFIITLRNAHNAVEDAAEPGSKEARNTDGFFTGFAQVTITKNELRDLMRIGFSGKESYWETINTSNVFVN